MTFSLAEDVLRRVLRNTGLLGAGKLSGTILHLACLALSARLLGPAAFGMLILVRSYAQAASGIARFQSWQVLIRFGAGRTETGDREGLRDLAGLTVVLDAVTGLAAALAAALSAPLIAPWFGIGAESVPLAQLYCIVIPFLTSATPNGILRLFDRFDRLAWQNLVTPGVRLVAIAAGLLLGAPLWALVGAWLLSDIAGEMFLWQQAWRELKRRGYAGGALPSPRRAIRDHKGLVPFSLAANGAATVTQAATPLLTLFVGALLGTAAAGAYRVAQVVVEAAATPGELAMRSLFPELARLHARSGTEFWRLLGHALALCVGMGVALAALVALAGPGLLSVALGPGHSDARIALAPLAASLAPALALLPLEAALLALGRAGSLLLVRAGGTGIAFGAAALLVPMMDIRAIGAAVAIGSAVSLAGLLLVLAKPLRAHGRVR